MTAAETTKKITINDDCDGGDHNTNINDSNSMDDGAKKDMRDDNGTATAAASRNSDSGRRPSGGSGRDDGSSGRSGSNANKDSSSNDDSSREDE